MSPEAWESQAHDHLSPRQGMLVVAAARDWTRRGLMAPAALAQVEHEYGSLAATHHEAEHAAAVREPDPQNLGLAVLYALAGTLLGAAVITVPNLLCPRWSSTLVQLAGALVLGGAALGLRDRRVNQGLVQTLLVAFLVPLVAAAATAPDAAWHPRLWFVIVAGAAAGAVVLLPRSGIVVATAATVALLTCLVGIGAEAEAALGYHGPGFQLRWSLTAVLLLATVVYALACARRGTRPVWASVVLLGSTLVLGFCLYMLVDDGFALRDEATFLAFGPVALALLGAGLLLRELPIILAAAIVVAVDAIGYGFAVDVKAGVVVLVLVALGLMAVAMGLGRRRRRPTARPSEPRAP